MILFKNTNQWYPRTSWLTEVKNFNHERCEQITKNLIYPIRLSLRKFPPNTISRSVHNFFYKTIFYSINFFYIFHEFIFSFFLKTLFFLKLFIFDIFFLQNFFIHSKTLFFIQIFFHLQKTLFHDTLFQWFHLINWWVQPRLIS